MNAIGTWCPRCSQTELVSMDRNEIEIDVCPRCKGVWLDRGELDKIIERSTGLRAAAPDERRDGDRGHFDDRGRDRRRDGRDWDDDDDDRRGRRGNWLAELFD
jgi:hypothetical protein